MKFLRESSSLSTYCHIWLCLASLLHNHYLFDMSVRKALLKDGLFSAYRQDDLFQRQQHIKEKSVAIIN